MSPCSIPTSLQTAEYILVRHSGHMPPPPLTPLYDGPFKVVKQGSHGLKLLMGDKFDTVAVTCLKPVVGFPRPPTCPNHAATHHPSGQMIMQKKLQQLQSKLVHQQQLPNVLITSSYLPVKKFCSSSTVHFFLYIYTINCSTTFWPSILTSRLTLLFRSLVY